MGRGGTSFSFLLHPYVHSLFLFVFHCYPHLTFVFIRISYVHVHFILPISILSYFIMFYWWLYAHSYPHPYFYLYSMFSLAFILILSVHLHSDFPLFLFSSSLHFYLHVQYLLSFCFHSYSIFINILCFFIILPFNPRFILIFKSLSLGGPGCSAPPGPLDPRRPPGPALAEQHRRHLAEHAWGTNERNPPLLRSAESRHAKSPPF